jgi:hypothetical protein
MKRKTSYQKLKEENARLRRDIYKMVRGTFEEQFITKKRYLFEYECRDAALAGDILKEGKEFIGLLKIVNK